MMVAGDLSRWDSQRYATVLKTAAGRSLTSTTVRQRRRYQPFRLSLSIRVQRCSLLDAV
jgi:hypothetical protein